jgi:hypothetical protein
MICVIIFYIKYNLLVKQGLLKMEKNNSYKCGLNIGDYIEYEVKHFFGNFKESSMVLDKKYLFSQMTKWGEKSFFEYTVYNNGKVKKINTKKIRLLSRKRTH